MLDPITIITATIASASVLGSYLLTIQDRRNIPAYKDRIWWLPMVTVLAASALLLSMMLHGSNDTLFFIVLICPLVCFLFLLWLIITIKKRPRRSLSIFLALVGFVAVSWSL